MTNITNLPLFEKKFRRITPLKDVLGFLEIWMGEFSTFKLSCRKVHCFESHHQFCIEYDLDIPYFLSITITSQIYLGIHIGLKLDGLVRLSSNIFYEKFFPNMIISTNHTSILPYSIMDLSAMLPKKIHIQSSYPSTGKGKKGSEIQRTVI